MATLSVAPTSIGPGGSVVVTWSGATLPTDSLNWWPVGGSQAVDWVYLSGNQVAPASAMSNGSLTLKAPTTTGTYKLRLQANVPYALLAEVDVLVAADGTNLSPAPADTGFLGLPPTIAGIPTTKMNVILGAVALYILVGKK